MSDPRILFTACAFVGTTLPSIAQTMVTKYLYEFDTLGAGHPNDLINDHQAFVNAAAFFQARDGYGTLILEDGEYIVGRQQLHWFGDTLPGTDWTNYGYPSNDSTQCKALVAIQPGFRLDDCSQFTLQGGANTTVRYRDCLYYGTFLRTPGTDEVYSAAGVDTCHSCLDSLHLPGLLHASVGIMFSFHHCDSITVRDVELNGNIDGAILGGRSSDDGIQTEYDGIQLFESSNCLIDNVDAHHFGRDGLLFWGTYADSTSLFTDVYPDLDVGIDPADSSFAPWKRTVLFNNQVHNSSFTWNGRQGFSWTALSGLQVTDCDFNYNGAGRMASSPSSGLDIEGAGGPIRVRHGTFDDCRFLHNRAGGIITVDDPCLGQQDFTFTDCTIKAGTEAIALWPSSRGMRFHECEIYGHVDRLFEQAENLPNDTSFNLVFRNTNFYEEDDQWSYLGNFPDSTWATDCGGGPLKVDMVGEGRAACVTFDSCGFYTNCRGKIRLAGRWAADTHYRYCPDCPDYPDCYQPYLGADTAQDARFITVTDCIFRNTGRMRCTDSTQVLAIDLATVDGFTIDIPATVRGGGPGDIYSYPFGEAWWAPTCYPYYCDWDTIITTDYSEGFPPCLPFFTIPDTIARWDLCDTTNNVLVQACPNDANCYSERAISDGIHSSTLGVGLSMTSVYIDGQFIIDNNFVIDQCQVRMGAGAEIIVTGGHVLEVADSDLSACHSMWRSITVQDSAVANVFNSTIADAQYGVKALDGAMVSAYGSSFQRNYVGIEAPDDGGLNTTVINVHGTEFSTAGTLAPPYAGQTPALGTKGYAGIAVNDMSLLIYGWNTFTDLSNGIVADGCDLSVTECTFEDIQPDAAYLHPANGSGIRANGQYGFFTLKQAGHGQGGTPSFANCRWGIYTEYMNVYSEENNMADVGTAYRIDRSGYRDVDILNNKLDTRYNGIDLRFNDGAAHILVENNTITFGSDLPPGVVTKGHTAIHVAEGNTLNPSSIIKNNTIHYRTGAETAAFGIRMTSARDYLVADNQLYMANNAVNRQGIYLQGCERPIVSCNTVVGSFNNYNVYDGQSAIRHDMCEGPAIHCNDVDGTTNGIYFHGTNYGTDLRGNNIRTHKWGLHLDNVTVIEQQDHKGNLWFNNPTPGGLGAFDESGAPYWFTYDPTIPGSGGNPEPPSWDPPGLFQPFPGQNFECDDGIETYCQSHERFAAGAGLNLDSLIATDSLENNPYTDESKWMLEGDLYQKLDNDTTLTANNALLDAFYADMQNTTQAQFKLINDDYLVLFGLDSSVVAYLETNRVALEGLMEDLGSAMVQLADTTLHDSTRQQVVTLISGLQTSISQLTAWNATALALAANSRVLSAENVRTVNAGVGVSEIIEENERKVNDIYLSSVAKDIEGFTSAQAAELYDVALQCPMAGGVAVYRARALYSLIDANQEYDDAASCLPFGIVFRNVVQESRTTVIVIPNPASTDITVSCQLEADEAGAFILFDALGTEVLRSPLVAGAQQQVLSIARLSQGAYHYRACSARGQVGEGKLMVIR